MNWRYKKSVEIIEEEEIVKGIIDKLLNRDDVERLISPNSDEYFLIDSKNEYCVVISQDKFIIANHEFSVPVELGMTFNENIKKIVRNKIEAERQILKKTLLQNKTNLLKKISENI
tara:strand:- start:521 stop:868 length:348 start_codon:yes stop_codon:yes gene_type:complete